MNTLALTHVRIVTSRADRRINGARGSSHALCFGTITSHDLTRRDALACLKQGEAVLANWVTCPACRAELAR